MSTTTTTSPQLTSTTAPGKVFSSRQELAEHYKSDWHKYNLKRRQADLPVLDESDFQARLEAALQLKQERETKQERTGKDHLKHHEKNQKKKKKNTRRRDGIFTVKSQAAAYDRIKEVQHQTDEDEIMVQNDDDDDDNHRKTWLLPRSNTNTNNNKKNLRSLIRVSACLIVT
jgi:pre-60S factor REI1